MSVAIHEFLPTNVGPTNLLTLKFQVYQYYKYTHTFLGGWICFLFCLYLLTIVLLLYFLSYNVVIVRSLRVLVEEFSYPLISI